MCLLSNHPVKHDPVDGRLGAFCGILLLSGLTQWLEPAYNLPLLYASFGASAVLVFGVISSPLAQPRNFIGVFGPTHQVHCCLCTMDSSHHNFVPQDTLQILRGYPVFQVG